MRNMFIRIHPVWWILLIFCCGAVLAFAVCIPECVPAQMQTRLAQPVSSDGLAQVILKLADPQGLPIEEAQIKTHASMPMMPMQPPLVHITSVGRGVYLVQLHLTMAGQWLIAVSAQATGFSVPSKTLTIEVRKQGDRMGRATARDRLASIALAGNIL